MSVPLQIRRMTQSDIDIIHKGLSGNDISKPLDYVKSCWEENKNKERVTLLVFYENEFVGWGHVVYKSQYPYFSENDIPEIQNFDIIPPFRKRGIGSVLIEALEEDAFAMSNTIGIGFGLYANYGTAQRLYMKRGFIPDGRGIMYNNLPVEPGSQVCVDDDLSLFLIKTK
ncbi:GNAT family N-acetyltransferase [Paenibacillus eucommiae]|uniref:GNAT superfamily N-acetyltransferase n=1 Tax=Paenibacillus eucommiae TaxID=1355755 RepID=A0ABS4IPQ8_9BACL|nr:GNAT family N-acetyltransferase [Paenibacillus eucommiae]MBP1989544.1 GNAT superfamily N-acetyltransferase [Paenibacillus eucommiae]